MLFRNIAKKFLHGVEDKKVYDQIFDNYLSEIDCHKLTCEAMQSQRKLIHFFVKMHKRQNEIKKNNDEFWAGVFHDIKSPMMSINFALSELLHSYENSGVLKTDRDASPVEQEILFDIYNFNLSNLNFIQNLLDAYKFEHGVYLDTKETINLKEMFSKLTNDFKYYIKEKRLKFHLDIAGDLTVQHSSFGLLRLFSNLILNAIKFATANTVIEIKATKHDKSIFISIKNKGKKIKESALKSIFQKFHTGFSNDKSPQSVQNASNGLGLYVCAQIIQKTKGGKIWAQNMEDGVSFNVEMSEAI